jgi:hypothetical protein
MHDARDAALLIRRYYAGQNEAQSNEQGIDFK